MTQQERPIIDRVWEFTKDISVKVSKQAEKHWKINTLRVEIASIKHKKNNCCKELGKFVYESLQSNTVEEDSYKTSLEGFFVEIQNLDNEIMEREKRIEVLSAEPLPPTPEDDMDAQDVNDETAAEETVKEDVEEVPEEASEESVQEAEIVDEAPKTEEAEEKEKKK